MDWIDVEKDRRDRGVMRALSPSHHDLVYARYPGCTVNQCKCGADIDDAQSECDECIEEERKGTNYD